MQAQRAELRFVLPALPSLREPVQALVRQHAGDAGVQVLDGQSHDALAACDVTLVASGTATLEAALLKRPMVITYAVSAINWWRMRRMALQPWVGLPNILAREFVVPELIQDAATPEALARETLAWLDDNARVQALQRRFHDLHLELRRDTASTATHALEKILQA
jgi:lipid-A-disaccharide synthase